MEEAEAPDPQPAAPSEPPVPPPPSSQATPPTPSEAIAAIRIRAPTRGNRKLDQLFDAVNADPQVKAWWHMAGVNAARLELTDHSWVHIQIVTNIALRLARLLFRRGIVPAMVSDHRMTERDAEVVIAAAALFHCVGMSIHRTDHEQYSLFLAADRIIGGADGAFNRGMQWQGLSLRMTLHHEPTMWIPSTYMPTLPGRLFYVQQLRGPLVAECN